MRGTLLHVNAPAHEAGTVNVIVVTDHGRSAVTRADRYTYVAPPAIRALSVTSGPPAGGTTVTVSGSSFEDVTAVRLGSSEAASFHRTSSRSLQFVTPAHAAGTVQVRIIGDYGASSGPSGKFTFKTASTSTTSTLAWSTPVATGLTGTATGMDCFDSTFCIAIDSTGQADVRQGSASTITQLGTTDLTGIDCTSPAFCVTVSSAGDAYIYDGSVWSAATVVGSGIDLTGVSCSTGEAEFVFTTCLVTSSTGSTYTYAASSDTRSTQTLWTGPTSLNSGNLTGISCPNPLPMSSVQSGSGDSFADSDTITCWVASGTGATVQLTGTWTYTNQTGDETFDESWGAADTVDPDAALTTISCGTASSCDAVDSNGKILYLADGTWTAPTVVAGADLTSVSCPPNATTCTAIGGSDSYPISGQTVGTPVSAANGDILASVSCPTVNYCGSLDNHHQFRDESLTVTSDACMLKDVPAEPALPNVGYAILGTQQDGKAARWNPCNTIYYAVVDNISTTNQTYFDSGSTNYMTDLANVVSQAESATGLSFEQYTSGATGPDGSYAGVSDVPSSVPVRISWVDFNNGTTGQQVGGTTNTTYSGQVVDGTTHDTAIVGANTELSNSLPPGFGDDGDGVIMLHEMGHILGLSDLCAGQDDAGGNSCSADDQAQAEYLAVANVTTWQEGDLNGLYLLSSAQGDTGY